MLRKIIFWAHLVAGIVAGVAIAIMSFTGAALTFDKDLQAWAERDARRVEAPAGATRLSVEELARRVLAAKPEARIANVAVSADPRDAVVFGLAGNVTLCANPYTGEFREPDAPRMRAFLTTMRAWHVRLNFKPGPGNAGFVINAAANVFFVFLGVSGLVIWWPRAWSWRVLRPAVWFTNTRGKARDWNWHNVFGLWFLPLLLVLAGTGVVLSYRWAGDLVFRIAGETPPANGAPPASPPLRLAPPPAGSTPLTSDALIAATQKAYPNWALVTLRFNPQRAATPATAAPARTATLQMKEKNPWPRFASPTVTVDAYSGEVLRREGYDTLSSGMRARRWIRLLHSGEALGRVVQLLSGLACVAGCVLVYTGFALAWRRFFPGKNAARLADAPSA